MGTNSTVLEMYANPSVIQSTMLKDMQERITGGRPIVDGNNVCSFLMEAFSSITSGLTNGILNQFESLYAKRAQTANQLYKHMSDFDYIGLFATPATVYVEVLFRKDYLLQSAVDVDATYKKLVIPRLTKIVLDQYAFTLYYPIEIRINKVTETFLVVYDTTATNPLHTLSTNTLEHRIFQVDGLEMLSIMVPAYQFVRTEVADDSPTAASFIKSYAYTDKFYAIRVYTNNGVDSTWVEIAQTLSDDIYDPSVLTARITVDTDLKKVKVIIPQVYFTQGLVGTRIKVELLTTTGAMDADVSNIAQSLISVSFPTTGDTEADRYISPLSRPDLLIVRPVSTRIVGGSDGITFEQLRDRVIHNSFYGTALLGPKDIQNYFLDKGFSASIYQDGITNRIYLAHKELTDAAGVVSPVAMVPCIFTKTSLQDIDTINANDDGSYTVLPTTLYKYDRASNSCAPLTNSETATLSNMTKAQKVAAYNSNSYTVNPYHLRITAASKYPLAYLYDLTNPSISNIAFVRDNTKVLVQMTVFNTRAFHYRPWNNGFDLEFEVIKSADLADVSPDDLKVVLVATSGSGNTILQECEFESSGDNNVDLYKAHLASNYDINDEHHIKLMSMVTVPGVASHMVPLSSTMRLVFFVKRSFFDPIADVSTIVGADIAAAYSDYVPLTEQSMTVSFGALIDTVHSKLNVMYSAQEYLTYDETTYATYGSPVFQRDENNMIVYPLVVEHEVGDTIYQLQNVLLTEDNIEDYYGSIVVADDVELTADNAATYVNTYIELRVPALLHKLGDPVLDINGNPIISKDREIIYAIDMLQVDNKFALSNRTEHLTYFETLANTLRSYYLAIKEATSQLREEVWLYFQPFRSIGDATFRIGNTTTVSTDLELSIKLRLFVYPHVVEDTDLLTNIRQTCIDIIDEHVKQGYLSSIVIANTLLNKMPAMLKYVDVLGINNDANVQTLIRADNDVLPSLKQRLTLADDGTISMERALDLEFVSVDIE